MKAMILAAGLGKRMGELTRATPKALIQLRGAYLIEYALHSLVNAGIKEIVINVSYRGSEIKQALGDGKRYGVTIKYSEEMTPLETGGGIANALPLLDADTFLVMSSDIITDYPLQQLITKVTQSAHLVLVENPDFHPQGDFGLLDNQLIDCAVKPYYTFANLAIYRQHFFTQTAHSGYFPLSQLLFPAIARGEITGEVYRGLWYNIGSPLDLERAALDPNLPIIRF